MNENSISVREQQISECDMIVLFYRISVVKCILYYTDFTAAKHGNIVEFALSANSINNNIK